MAVNVIGGHANDARAAERNQSHTFHDTRRQVVVKFSQLYCDVVIAMLNDFKSCLQLLRCYKGMYALQVHMHVE